MRIMHEIFATMDKFSWVVLSFLVMLVCGKEKMEKKGFVVEVQSHQQAMKLANPITDLEQTITRGMNDPYTDPRFVMNQINDEFFGNGQKTNINAGTPMAANSPNNRESMAFRNVEANPQGPRNLNRLSKNMLPSNTLFQHAVKENNVAIGEPSSQIDQALSTLMKFSHRMGVEKHPETPKLSSAISPYNIPKIQTDTGVPTNVRIAHLSSDAIHASQKKEEEGALTRSNQLSSQAISSDMNEKAEEGAQESGPSMKEISTAIGASAQSIGDTLSSLIAQKGAKSTDILPSNPGSISGKEMEDNFSSIKAFIDADEILKDKKVLESASNPLEDLMHKKHKVPTAKMSLRKLIRSK